MIILGSTLMCGIVNLTFHQQTILKLLSGLIICNWLTSLIFYGQFFFDKVGL